MGDSETLVEDGAIVRMLVRVNEDDAHVGELHTHLPSHPKENMVPQQIGPTSAERTPAKTKSLRMEFPAETGAVRRRSAASAAGLPQ